MDYIAGLVQRGLISPDVAQGLVQNVADLKNRMPFESGGGAPTNSVYAPRGYGDQVIARVQQGKSNSEIAKEFGIKNRDVTSIIKAWRSKPSNPVSTQEDMVGTATPTIEGHENIVDRAPAGQGSDYMAQKLRRTY